MFHESEYCATKKTEKRCWANVAMKCEIESKIMHLIEKHCYSFQLISIYISNIHSCYRQKYLQIDLFFCFMIFLKASHTLLIKTQAYFAGFAHKTSFGQLRFLAIGSQLLHVHLIIICSTLL